MFDSLYLILRVQNFVKENNFFEWGYPVLFILTI